MVNELAKNLADIVIEAMKISEDMFTSPYFLTPLGIGAVGLNVLEYYATLRRGRIYHNNDIDKLRESDNSTRLVKVYDSEGNRLDHPFIDMLVSPGRRLAYHRLQRRD